MCIDNEKIQNRKGTSEDENLAVFAGSAELFGAKFEKCGSFFEWKAGKIDQKITVTWEFESCREEKGDGH